MTTFLIFMKPGKKQRMTFLMNTNLNDEEISPKN